MAGWLTLVGLVGWPPGLVWLVWLAGCLASYSWLDWFGWLAGWLGLTAFVG